MKKIITVTKKIKARFPFFIAAWPGMGNVAIKAITFLKDKLGAQEFATLNPEYFFEPTGIDIANSLVSVTPLPQGKFFFHKHPTLKNDIIIFISEQQPSFEKSYDYARSILDFVKEFHPVLLCTCAALPSPIDHTKKPGVWIAATQKLLLDKARELHINSMPTGTISGLNGLLLGVAKDYAIPGICLLGEIPFYTMQADNPFASLALLEVLSKIVSVRINVADLQQQSQQFHQEIDKLINFFKNPEAAPDDTIGTEEIEKIKESLDAYTKIPESVRKKIEELFEKTKQDSAHASELKKELDSWNLYKDYEDRFLDLFRKDQKKNN